MVAPSWQSLLPLWLRTAAHLFIYLFLTPFSTAPSLVRESLWFLLRVTDFYMAWMPVVPVKNLDPEAWHPAIYCSQGFCEFTNLKLKEKRKEFIMKIVANARSHTLIMWEASGLIFINLDSQSGCHLTLLFDLAIYSRCHQVALISFNGGGGGGGSLKCALIAWHLIEVLWKTPVVQSLCATTALKVLWSTILT